MTPKQRQVSELQSRIQFLEATNQAILDENNRLKSGDNNDIIERLRKSVKVFTDELERCRGERDDAQRKFQWAQVRITELNQELEKIKQRRGRKQPPELELPSPSKEMWRRLVQLCHPDRHGDSQTATEATRWLMENRP